MNMIINQPITTYEFIVHLLVSNCI